MPSHPKAADLPALLATLCDSGVEFIIVGGVAAVLQGVPITTTDLDIVHRRTPENVTRLLEVLLRLDATMRYDLGRRGLRPTAEMLAGGGRSTSPRRWDRSTLSVSSPRSRLRRAVAPQHLGMR
jgi:hypothetical protein